MLKTLLNQLLMVAFLWLISCNQPQSPSVTSTTLDSNTNRLMQAISIVDENIAWISGHRATFIQTTDGGMSWKAYGYDQIDSLQFRDIHAFDDKNAVLMSAGPGSMSRILLVNLDSGFTETYVMPHEEGFLNTIEFWDDQNGLAFGDSFNGELFVLKTTDGGTNWDRIDPSLLPPAGKGEGGFAASGTCISTRPGGKAWIGTGAGGNARVLYTEDYGDSWNESQVPIITGDAAGIASINMATDLVGVIAGGDLAISDQYTDNVAITQDGGKNWTLTSQPQTKGAFYGSDVIPWKDGYFLISSGPKGIDYSFDLGKTFSNLDTLNYWAVNMHEAGFGYAAGTEGKVIKLEIVDY
ncbi:WD40/YVTN/BNR-like repeat-containing protein [Marinoscillum sp.]|uniref:WD40/YVTN/BNR-like repeat-containing protein n=1 Tax=Marinoscillum sp. TaxID=2024838 RepID=UPI003BA8DA70